MERATATSINNEHIHTHTRGAYQLLADKPKPCGEGGKMSTTGQGGCGWCLIWDIDEKGGWRKWGGKRIRYLVIQ